MPKLHSGKGLGTTTTVDGPKKIRTERQTTRALARTIGPAQLDTTAFVVAANLFCVGGARVFQVQLQLQKNGIFVCSSVPSLSPRAWQTPVFLFSFISGLIPANLSVWCSVDQELLPAIHFLVPGAAKLSLSTRKVLHSFVSRSQFTVLDRHVRLFVLLGCYDFPTISNCSNHRHILTVFILVPTTTTTTTISSCKRPGDLKNTRQNIVIVMQNKKKSVRLVQGLLD